MKVLLDANTPHDLRLFLRHHETFTAAYLGWANLKNGDLLSAAEAEGFDVLVTGDKTLHHEQNMDGHKIALVSLSAVNWPVIEPYVTKIVMAVDNARPGSFTYVEVGGVSAVILQSRFWDSVPFFFGWLYSRKKLIPLMVLARWARAATRKGLAE